MTESDYMYYQSTSRSPENHFLPSALSNIYHAMGWFSRQQIDDIFLIFPRKQDLIFQANLGDSLHEMSNPVFWEKYEKYFKMSYAENFTQSAKH